jgi:F1F0 ATPase subunit 2
MSEISMVALAVFAGFMLGAVFFGGLWWTIQRGFASAQPAVWFSSSLLLRTTMTLGGFLFVTHGDWRRMVGCLAGFLIARFLILRFSRGTSPIEEGAS